MVPRSEPLEDNASLKIGYMKRADVGGKVNSTLEI